MANIIVVSFQEETKAIAALHKIKELDAYGDITLYEHILIHKKENNHYDVLHRETDIVGWRALTGMALGGLVGTIIGPVSIALGLITGTTAGAVLDYSYYDFEDDFVKKIRGNMKPGTLALIAEINEESSVFINEALKPFGVKIFRTDADAEYLDFIEDDIERLEDKIEKKRKKIKNATTQEKEKLQNKIADLKMKRKAKMAKLEAKGKSTLQELKEKTKAQINILENRLEDFGDSISDAFAKAKANRLKKRIQKQRVKLDQLNEELEDVLD